MTDKEDVHIQCIQLNECGDKYTSIKHLHNLYHKHTHPL